MLTIADSQKEHGMEWVFYNYDLPFRLMFDVPLSMYFDINRGGFQITPFLTQVVEYEGPQPGQAIFKKYGPNAQHMIANIMNGCKEVILIGEFEPDENASR